MHESVIRQATRDAGLTKRVTTYAFCHAFATHMLEDGYDIRTVQELLGRRDVKTTMIYTHVLNCGGRGVRSPLEGIHEMLAAEGSPQPRSMMRTDGSA